MSEETQLAPRIFKALGDETRLKILEILWEEGRERCACVLLLRLGISQSTLSHHMKILSDAGLVRTRRAGKWALYTICPEGLLGGSALLDRLANPNPPRDDGEEEAMCGI